MSLISGASLDVSAPSNLATLFAGLLKKLIGDRGIYAGSLSTLLSAQGPNLRGALDSRLTGALGFTNPDAFLGGIAGEVGDGARRTAAAVMGGGTAVATTATPSSLMRWIPWTDRCRCAAPAAEVCGPEERLLRRQL